MQTMTDQTPKEDSNFLEHMFGKNIVVKQIKFPNFAPPETQNSIHLHKARRYEVKPERVEGQDYVAE